MFSHIIVGGGFFGAYLATHLATHGATVALLEQGEELLGGASTNNQARVHNGYHYPRSLLTALRSNASYRVFRTAFEAAIVDDFDAYYGVSALQSKVSVKQFELFCDRIGAVRDPAPTRISNLVNKHLVAALYRVEECAFNVAALRDIIVAQLAESGVEVFLQSRATRVRAISTGVEVGVETMGAAPHTVRAHHVFNCTYSAINDLCRNSALPALPLRHEATEMCLFTPPKEITKIGLTIMCGPFFSAMPWPSTPYHSLSHVRYTPHLRWDHNSHAPVEPHAYAKALNSRWNLMLADAKRYVPVMATAKYQRSIWETKTILPRSDTDDSRPILFKQDWGIRGFHCVMGGKIDNVFDAARYIQANGL